MIFYLFLDGVGWGKYSPEKNPFSRFARSYLAPMGGIPLEDTDIPKNFHFIRTDAHMGLPGLPQSATGQTAIWTGINGAKVLGRHVSGFPTITLRKIIQSHSILKILKEAGKQSDFLNCFSPHYLKHVEEKPKLVSASTLVQLASGNSLKTIDDLRQGNGLYMDLTHEILKETIGSYLSAEDPVLKIQDPFWIGTQIKERFSRYDLCIFEYFITDKVGHAMDWTSAERVIGVLESFFAGLVSQWNPEEDLLLVTSDHGNLEDLSQKNHTENPVSTIAYGKNSEKFAERVRSLPDIVPILYEIFELDEEREKLNSFTWET